MSFRSQRRFPRSVALLGCVGLMVGVVGSGASAWAQAGPPAPAPSSSSGSSGPSLGGAAQPTFVKKGSIAYSYGPNSSSPVSNGSVVGIAGYGSGGYW
jgi:hypothetical protein